MSLIERMKTWLVAEAPEELQLEPSLADAVLEESMTLLNAVPITGAQLEAAAGLIAHIQVRSLADMQAHALILQDYARSLGFDPERVASAALHARIAAFDKWCAEFDPHGETDRAAAFEAAAQAPLINNEHGVAFEPISFRELINFIAELPF